MITAFMATGELHAVHVINQKGLTKIRAISMCTVEGDVGPGVYQVPLWAFDGRPQYGETVPCQKCARIVTTMQAPPT
jgi:hypothetical protein